jgi:hypothetical protein
MAEDAVLPSNSDRAALGKILAIIGDAQDCEAALREIQMVAVIALNARVRLATTRRDRFQTPSTSMLCLSRFAATCTISRPNVDPTEMVRENMLLRDTVAALEARLGARGLAGDSV